jgi:putative SOS response-associated peptidase YedK
MCGRMTMTLVNWNEVLREFKEILAAAGVDAAGVDADGMDADEALSLYRPRYNIAPAQAHLVLRRFEGRARLCMARWGLPVRGPGKAASINVRAETVASKPVFREALTSRRCVVPADGFLEWKTGPEGRQPIWFHRPDGRLLLLAGLFDEEPREANQSPRTRFAVLTTAANTMLAAFHSRMPVLLSPEEAATWLAGPDPRLLRAARDDLLVASPVSLRVNSIRHDDPACLAPPRNVQLSLF